MASNKRTASALDIDQIKDRLGFGKDELDPAVAPDADLRSGFYCYVESLKLFDEIALFCVKNTWFKKFSESSLEIVTALIQTCLDRHSWEISEFLECYLRGLPDFVFNTVDRRSGSLIYKILRKDFVNVRENYNFLQHAVQLVFNRISTFQTWDWIGLDLSSLLVFQRAVLLTPAQGLQYDTRRMSCFDSQDAQNFTL